MLSVSRTGLLRRRWLVIGLAIAWAISSAQLTAAARLIAVGDVHGDVPALEQTLVAAGAIDEDGQWRGGDTQVVQIGDLLDRGPQLRGALEFVMALEARAAENGGRFIQILGNHEVMNLLGDLRYVTAENFAEFTDDRSEHRRDELWQNYREWQRRRAARLGLPKPDLGSAARKEWLAAHPLGLIEHREMFAPDGRYGRWLRERPSVLRLGDVLFVHGGLSPALAGLSPAVIDRRVHDEIREFDRLKQRLVELDLVQPTFDLVEMILAMRDELAALDREAAVAQERGEAVSLAPADAERRQLAESLLAWDTWSIYSSDGPLWFRGYSRWSDEEIAEQMPALLSAFGARHIVVGHTPQEGGRIRVRADGGVFLIDAGMNTAYVPGGRHSALEIVDGAFSAIYPGEQGESLWQPGAAATPAFEAASGSGAAPAGVPGRRWLGRDGEPLPFADDDALLEFLSTAPIVDDEPIGQGITQPHRLTMERDGVRARATFRSVEEKRKIAQLGRGRREMNFRDYYGFEPAAYQLGRLLGIYNIPPSALRRVKGKSGSVQIWVEKAITEGRRLESKEQPPNTVRWLRQLQMMRLWDDLVGNTDRNQGNILFDSGWQLWMIDHTRAFRHSVDLQQAEKTTWCERGFFEKLHAVSDDEIREAMRDLLAPGEIRGVLERRAKIVTILDKLVGERGEEAVLFRWTE